MSIFTRAKKTRERDYKIAEELKKKKEPTVPPPPPPPPQYAQHQATVQPPPEETIPPPPEPPKIQEPVSVTMPPETMMDKLTTQEIKEEIVELSDEEKSEFVKVLLSKYRDLYKDIDKVLAQVEESKIHEKRGLEETYRKQLAQIDKRYEDQKEIVKDKYRPTLDRYKSLAEKFKVPILGGGMIYEDKIQQEPKPKPVQTGEIRPPEDIFKDKDKSDVSKEEGVDPGISKILKEMDDKYQLPKY